VLCALHREGGFSLRKRLRMKLTGRRFVVDTGLGYPVMRGWDSFAGAPVAAGTFRPDLVVVQGYTWPRLAARFAQLGLPVLVYLHSADEVAKLAELPPDGGIGLLLSSGYLASLLPAGVAATVMPPLVLPERYRVEPERKVVTYFNPQRGKGLDVAIRLVQARPDVTFEFVLGRHAPPADWRELDFVPGRFRNVVVAGPFTDMMPVYRRSRLILMPSRWAESWGRVVTEAQLSGIPVLASNRGALPDTVGAGGVCLDPDAPAAEWEAAFAAIWDDAGRYDALCAAARTHAARAEIAPEVISNNFLRAAAALVA
jgi:glycosyltransferase involved in cell wall biosynthesis